MLGCMMPISSPMMKRMLGFCCCCAAAGRLAAEIAAIEATQPGQTYLTIRILRFLPRLPVTGRQPVPDCSCRCHARGTGTELFCHNLRVIRRGYGMHGERIGCRSGLGALDL